MRSPCLDTSPRTAFRPARPRTQPAVACTAAAALAAIVVARRLVSRPARARALARLARLAARGPAPRSRATPIRVLLPLILSWGTSTVFAPRPIDAPRSGFRGRPEARSHCHGAPLPHSPPPCPRRPRPPHPRLLRRAPWRRSARHAHTRAAFSDEIPDEFPEMQRPGWCEKG